MQTFIIFIAIAASVTLGVDGIKVVYNEIIAAITKKKKLADINWSVFIAFGLSMWAVISYGSGLMAVYGIDYTNIGFRMFDIITTGALLSKGANGIYDWLKSVGKDSTTTSITTTTKE